MGTDLSIPNSFKGKFKKPEIINGLPANFDSRTQWDGCVHAIRNQLKCGSCWAFGASETLSDRFCITSNKKINEVFSPEDMVACDDYNLGCSGGNLYFAWAYLTHTGVVTDKCFPYTSGDGTVPACATSCADGSSYKKYKCVE